MLAAIVSFALFALAYIQLSSIATTASADFIFKLKQDFFRDEVRILFHLIDHEWLTLKWVNKDLSYFAVETEEIDNSELPVELKHTLKGKPFYSEYEIDDVLIGHFEDMGMLVQRGALAFDKVYEMLSYYIETVFENDQIQRCMALQRERDPALYTHFFRIHKKCAATGRRGRPH